MKKISKSQYIWVQINKYLGTFCFLFLFQILFSPYGTIDFSKVEFYACLLIAISTTLFWYGKSILRLIKFAKNNIEVPDQNYLENRW